MIVHVEYRCPECDKVFNCPANLASHRRWHKPKGVNVNGSAGKEQPEESCSFCGKTFRKPGALRKHMQTHCNDNNNGGGGDASSPANKAAKSYDIDHILGGPKKKKEEELRCTVCQEVFATSRELQDHCLEDCKRRDKTSDDNDSIACPICPDLKFSGLAELARHAGKMHLVQQESPATAAPASSPLITAWTAAHSGPPLLSIAALASQS